ncbi:MAG: hypothetical protein KME50_27280 [Nostoc desertorum CM1-VF14]|jgi:hypothetical protein|nr:hypothetical protein [Nostoc desertorum CM1-VF14]
MWIAWVPEHGYFEINVPNSYNIKQLGQFWRSAPRNYRYIVLSTDGSLVFEIRGRGAGGREQGG